MKISSNKQTSSKDKVVSSIFVLPANYDDYCPHCCNHSLNGVGDSRAVCDSCGEEYELLPMPNNKIKLLPVTSATSFTAVKSAKDATWKTDKRLAGTSERYRGYLIVLDRGGDGYNVYDKHRELEDAGYPSKEAAKQFIDELVANDDVYSAESLVNSAETFDAQSYAKQHKQSSEFNKWLKRVESAISRNDTTRIKNIKESLMYMTSSQLSNKLASYLIDKLNSALTTSSDDIKSASYGGAFDIEDDQYFTKDEIIEFGNTVCDHLNETFYDTYEVSNVYMETPKKLVLTVTQKSDESEFAATVDIDMRKIKRPSDLMDRYLGNVVYALQQDIEKYNNEITSATVAASEVLTLDTKYGDSVELENGVYYVYNDEGELVYEASSLESLKAYNSRIWEEWENKYGEHTISANNRCINCTKSVDPTPNGYHNIWYITDIIIVHNDGGKYHVVDTSNGNTYIFDTYDIEELNNYLSDNYGKIISDPNPKPRPIEQPKKRYPLYLYEALEAAVANMDNIPDEHKDKFVSFVGDRTKKKKVPGVGWKSAKLPAAIIKKYPDLNYYGRDTYDSFVPLGDDRNGSVNYVGLTLEKALIEIYDAMKRKWFPESVNSSTSMNNNVNIVSSIEVDETIHSDALPKRLWDAAFKYMKSLGYEDDEIPSYVIINVQEQPDRRYVDLRAELNYDELTGLLDVMDPIVQECDENAYFEPVAPGIAEAYVYSELDTAPASQSVISASTGEDNLKQVAAKLRKYIKSKTGDTPAYPGRTVPDGYELRYFGDNPMSGVIKEFNENSTSLCSESIVDAVNEFSKLNDVKVNIETKSDSWNFEVICITILHDPSDFVSFDTAVKQLGRYVTKNFPKLSRVKWNGRYANQYVWMWEGDEQLCYEAANDILQFGSGFGANFETEVFDADRWSGNPSAPYMLRVRLSKPESRPLSSISDEIDSTDDIVTL